VGNQLHHDQITRHAAVDHWPQRGIAAVAAIPVRFAIELYRLEQLGQACRSKQRIDRHLLVRYYARQPRLDVGEGNVERRGQLTAERVDVDVRGDGLTQ